MEASGAVCLTEHPWFLLWSHLDFSLWPSWYRINWAYSALFIYQTISLIHSRGSSMIKKKELQFIVEQMMREGKKTAMFSSSSVGLKLKVLFFNLSIIFSIKATKCHFLEKIVGCWISSRINIYHSGLASDLKTLNIWRPRDETQQSKYLLYFVTLIQLWGNRMDNMTLWAKPAITTSCELQSI